MSSVMKLPDEPILIVNINFPLERYLHAARAAWVECNRQADASDGPFYAVLDLSEAAPDFADILIWLDERRVTPACQYRSPHLRVAVVGRHPMIALGARKVQRQLGGTIELYSDLSDALAAVRQAAGRQSAFSVSERF